jgi:hypothetical protein
LGSNLTPNWYFTEFRKRIVEGTLCNGSSSKP